MNFSVSFPESVEAEKEFQVTIKTDEPATYDVKIFITEDSKEFSEVYFNNDWKNPYYYLSEALAEEAEFKVLPHIAGETQLCVRLRNSAEKSKGFSEDCQQIIVTESTIKKSESSDSEENSKEDEPEDSGKEFSEIKTFEEFEPSKIQTLNYKTENNEKVILSSKAKEQKIITTTDGKTRTYILYGFSTLCVFLLVLFALKRM